MRARLEVAPPLAGLEQRAKAQNEVGVHRRLEAAMARARELEAELPVALDELDAALADADSLLDLEARPRFRPELAAAWRAHRVVPLGFTAGQALELALAGIDYHEAELLVAGGCPAATAMRILL
jgi:hypothetical protein